MGLRKRLRRRKRGPAGFSEIQTGAGSGRIVTLLPPPTRPRYRRNWRRAAPLRRLLEACTIEQTVQERIPSGYIVAGVFARAMTSARGVCILIEQAHGIPATMLARSLLEDVYVARWMLLRPTDAVERMAWHERAVELAWFRRARKLPMPAGLTALDESTFSADDIKRMESMFGPHLNQGLSGLSNHALMELTKEGLDLAEAQDLEQAWRVGLSISNAMLHTTSESISHANAIDLGWSKHVRMSGGQEADAEIALRLAGWSVLRLIDVFQEACTVYWSEPAVAAAYDEVAYYCTGPW